MDEVENETTYHDWAIFKVLDRFSMSIDCDKLIPEPVRHSHSRAWYKKDEIVKWTAKLYHIRQNSKI